MEGLRTVESNRRVCRLPVLHKSTHWLLIPRHPSVSSPRSALRLTRPVDSAPHSAGRSSQGRQVGRTIPATGTSSRSARCGRVPSIRHHTAVRFVREPHASMWHVLRRRVLRIWTALVHNQEPSSATGREHFKRPDDAEKMFQRAMALSPDNADAKFYYAALREQAATDCRRTMCPECRHSSAAIVRHAVALAKGRTDVLELASRSVVHRVNRSRGAFGAHALSPLGTKAVLPRRAVWRGRSVGSRMRASKAARDYSRARDTGATCMYG